jgi:hypothetical protein
MADAKRYAVSSFGFFLHFRRHRGMALSETPPKANKIRRE